MKTDALLLTAAVLAAVAGTSRAQVYSPNAVGYVNRSLPQVSIIANPLSNTNNTLNTLLAAAPRNTKVYGFDADMGWLQSIKVGDVWLPNRTFDPGEGFFLIHTLEAPLNVTFVGEVLQGNRTNVLKGGDAWQLKASQAPQALALGRPGAEPGTSLEFPAAEGDKVYLYDSVVGWMGYTYKAERGLWLGPNSNNGLGPTIPVGTGFWLKKAGADTEWTQNFQATPANLGAAPAQVLPAAPLLVQSQTTAPKIRVQPWSQTVALGSMATFQVAARGAQPLRYRWQKNTANIPGATNRVFRIATTTGASGNYRVIVSNAFGAVTSTVATLTVVPPPVITLQPVAQTVPLRTTVAFQVGASGSGPLRYQWRLNGKSVPGKTNALLLIPQATLANGGRYSVVVANGPATVASAWVPLLFNDVPVVPALDHFNQRLPLPSATNGMFLGTNTLATEEAKEPDHAGWPGSSSVWFTWTPPANGIATFSTAGSTFDTLLGVYRGTSLDNLNRVAADDERGGFYTSQVQFNAKAGTPYQIALDGHAGQTGHFVLSYGLEITPHTIPEIEEEPRNWAVAPGSSVTFDVKASGPGLTYQWLKNGVPIPTARSDQLTLDSVNSAQVGSYTVQVSNNGGRSVLSSSAMLQLSSVPGLFVLDRWQDQGSTNLWPSGAKLISLNLVPGTNGFRQEWPGGGGVRVPSPEGIDLECLCWIGGEPRFPLPEGDYIITNLVTEEKGYYTLDTRGSTVGVTLALSTWDCIEGQMKCLPPPAPDACGDSVLTFYAYAGATHCLTLAAQDAGEHRIVLNGRYGCLPTALLSISHEEPNVTLSWCDPLDEYELESTSNLSLPDSWSKVDLDQDPEQGVHTERIGAVPSRFFRLRASAEAMLRHCPDCP